jgi:hypothetical protein
MAKRCPFRMIADACGSGVNGPFENYNDDCIEDSCALWYVVGGCCSLRRYDEKV